MTNIRNTCDPSFQNLLRFLILLVLFWHPAFLRSISGNCLNSHIFNHQSSQGWKITSPYPLSLHKYFKHLLYTRYHFLKTNKPSPALKEVIVSFTKSIVIFWKSLFSVLLNKSFLISAKNDQTYFFYGVQFPPHSSCAITKYKISVESFKRAISQPFHHLLVLFMITVYAICLIGRSNICL